eukprot:UN25243
MVSELAKHFQVMFGRHMESFDTISEYLLKTMKLFLKKNRVCPYSKSSISSI